MVKLQNLPTAKDYKRTGRHRIKYRRNVVSPVPYVDAVLMEIETVL
jgi:hypothetical protein